MVGQWLQILKDLGQVVKVIVMNFILSLGYVPIDETKFAFQLNDFKNAGIDFTKKVNELDLKITTNYDFLSVVPNYNANISISNSF